MSWRSLPFYNNYRLYRLINYATMPTFSMQYISNGQEFLSVAIAQKRVSHSFADDAGLYDDFVVRSALFGFPDYVSVKFLDVKGGKSTLAIYSRSVYGRSDLGVNRARTLAWMALVNSSVKPLAP